MDNSKIKKSFRRMKHERKPGADPFVLGISQICEGTGHPEYFTPLRNRLLRELDVDEGSEKYLLVKPHVDDLFITSAGIKAFNKILTSYFSDADLEELSSYIDNVNELSLCKSELQDILSGLSADKIKSYMQEYQQFGTICGNIRSDHVYAQFEEALRKKRPLPLRVLASLTKNIGGNK